MKKPKTQNRSSAVMAQRVEASDSLDDFPTPPWATRAMVDYVLQRELHEVPADHTVWEPCCNRGHMAYGLWEDFAEVVATDVHVYDDMRGEAELWGFAGQHDFLQPYLPPEFWKKPPGWVIANPPFRLGAQFIARSLEVATRGVAMLVRTAFLESDIRYRTLFARQAPTVIAQFVERVPMVKGRLDRKAKSATAYSWLVWQRGDEGWRSMPRRSAFIWIPPCRARLERDADYPVTPQDITPNDGTGADDTAWALNLGPDDSQKANAA